MCGVKETGSVISVQGDLASDSMESLHGREKHIPDSYQCKYSMSLCHRQWVGNKLVTVRFSLLFFCFTNLQFLTSRTMRTMEIIVPCRMAWHVNESN